LIIRSRRTAIISLTISLIYLGLGIAQHKGVEEYISEVAKSRGHKIERLLLNPTIGNIVLWRSVYLYDGTYYIDAVHHPYLTSTKTKLLASNKTSFLDIEKQFPELKEGSKQKEDTKRFAYFSQGYVYLHPKHPNTIADLRYGSLPHDLYSLWGIKITPEQSDQHVTFKNLRNFEKDHYQLFWSMLKGKSLSAVKEEH
jgi:inner membrane protein